jgi:hypothetical protein
MGRDDGARGDGDRHSRATPAAIGTVYTFTQVQPSGVPDQVFDGQVQALRHELATLKAILERELVGI